MLFDFFGTLVTYDASIHADRLDAHVAFARRFRGTIPAEEADRVWLEAWALQEEGALATGREYSMDELADAYAQGLGVERPDADSRARFIARFFRQWCAPIRPLPGVHDVLDALVDEYELLVVSNTHHSPLVPALITRFGLEAYFSSVITSIDHSWRKPNRRLFAVAREACSRRPEWVSFVGDTWEADIEGSWDAGFLPFHVGPRGPGRPSLSLGEVGDILRSRRGELERYAGVDRPRCLSEWMPVFHRTDPRESAPPSSRA